MDLFFRKKNARLGKARLWKTGLWITLSLETGSTIIAEKYRHFKGSCPVDKLMILLDFFNL